MSDASGPDESYNHCDTGGGSDIEEIDRERVGDVCTEDSDNESESD